MDNELSFALAWAITATLSTMYYLHKANKFERIAFSAAIGLAAIAKGKATITETKDGVSIRRKDD